MNKEEGIEKVKIFANGALSELEKRVSQVNDLNIFPVPDGDTGTNLCLTMQGAIQEMENDHSSSVSEIVEAAAKGALASSRGNSGVIFAQFLDGLTQGVKSSQEPGIREVIKGLNVGAQKAREAVEKPVEGTILTVMDEMAKGVAEKPPSSGKEMLLRVHGLARDSLRNSPKLLEALAKSGVVDAGAAGLVAGIEGGIKALGLQIKPFEWEKYLEKPKEVGYTGPKWDVQFSLACSPEDTNEAKKILSVMGESFVFAGHEKPFRVHIHSDYPNRVVRAARNWGQISGLHIEALENQVREVIRDRILAEYRILAISCCDAPSLSRVFEEAGSYVIAWDGVNVPQEEDFLEPIKEVDFEAAVILPNDPKLIEVAESVSQMTKYRIEVIPTVSPLQGLSAMEEYLHLGEPDDVIRNMKESAFSMKIGMIEKERETYFGLAQGNEVCASKDIKEVFCSLLEALSEEDGEETVTFLASPEIEPSTREELERLTSEKLPHCEQEWYQGGQFGPILHIGLE